MSRLRPSIFNPIHLCFSAIFQREVTVSGRKWSTFLHRGGYALTLLAILSLAFASQWQEGRRLGPALQLQQNSATAPTLAYTLIWLQFIVLSLLATVLTADAVCGERTARTLPTLLTTPLRPAQIIFSKLTSRLLEITILILASVPILLLIRVYGGLELEFIFAGAVLAIAASGVAASIALMFSIWHRRAWSVVVVTGPCMALFFLGLPAIAGTLEAFDLPYAAQVAAASQIASPPFALGAAAVGRSIFPGFTLDTTWIWLLSTLWCIVVTALIGAFSSFALRRIMLAEAHGWKAGRGSLIPRIKSRRESRKGAAQKERPSRDIRGNPITWREFRTPLLGTRSSTILLGSLAIIGIGLFYWRIDMDEIAAHIVLAIIMMLLQLLASAGITTSSVSSEREARTLDVLFSTPITTRQIIFGKLLGASRRLAIVPVFMTVHFLIFSLRGTIEPYATIIVPMLFIAPTVFLAGLGLFWGTVFKKSKTAVMFNFASAFAIWLAFPLLASIIAQILGQLTDLWELEGIVQTGVMIINPVALLVMILLSSGDTSFSDGQIYIGSMTVTPVEASLLIFGVTVCACGIGLLMAHFGSRILERQRARGR